MLKWANLLHIYQPPGQKKKIIDQVVLESYDRILSVLESQKETKISLNICSSLTQQLFEFGHQDIVERIKRLAENSRIELVGSAAYHPILPLLPKTEIIRQIRLNEEINQKYFGQVWRPPGFFLPELAYSKKVAKIIQNLGYKWLVLDELAYQGNFGQVSFDKIYKLRFPFCFLKRKDIKIIFRNRGISLLFFGKWLDSIDPVRGRPSDGDRKSLLRDFVSNGVDKFFSAVKKDKRSDEFLVTAFDGENLGHHCKHLDHLWSEILNNPEIKTITYSEYLQFLQVKPVREVDPLASSWSTEIKDLKDNNPYPLWSDSHNQIHKNFQQISNIVFKLIKKAKNNPNYKLAREILDRALSSDSCWWASARPWWGPSMIELEVERFSEIVRLLEKEIPLKFKKKIEFLGREILNMVQTKNFKK